MEISLAEVPKLTPTTPTKPSCRTCTAGDSSIHNRSMSSITKVEALPEAFEEAVTEIKGYKPLMIGLDTKTQLESEMVSIITICVPDTMTYIFEINKIWKTYSELPPGLIRLLQSPHIIKVMFDPVSRSEQLKGYGIRFDGVIDVRAAARVRGHNKTGVDSLAKALFRTYQRSEHWRKRKFFIQTKWAENVSDDMARYTGSRAYLALVIYNALCAQPLVPFDAPSTDIRVS
uniref:3'-5' exonuclease n=1 Tax=Pithovirus LCPAC103 TaxID=2506588 RepID=A0A481Z4B1_9VIRU|nr:MAG: 3'-5' exonuclease [Pithovirus LCPAC103]